PEPYVVGDDTICNDQLRVFKWARLTGLNIANGAGFYIRWASGRGSGSGSSHGIAIDDVVVRIPCKVFSTVDTTLCWNDTFITSDNRIYTSSQLVYDTLLNAAVGDCDSIISYQLTFLPAPMGSLDTTVCSNQLPLHWYGYSNAQNGDTVILSSTQGCDSIVTLNLTVLPALTSTVYDTICQGQTYTFNGNTYNSTQTVTATFISTGGCDSIVTLNLTVLPALTSTVYDTICQGQTYSFNGNTYNSTQTVTATFIS